MIILSNPIQHLTQTQLQNIGIMLKWFVKCLDHIAPTVHLAILSYNTGVTGTGLDPVHPLLQHGWHVQHALLVLTPTRQCLVSPHRADVCVAHRHCHCLFLLLNVGRKPTHECG